jgi:hypothetical protein
MSSNHKRISGRRARAWWEPTYDPKLESSLAEHDWQFGSSTGPKRSFLSWHNLKKICQDGQVQSFENLTFEDCDIQGYFEHRPAIAFKKCRFHNCDFSYSDWYRTTFTDCEFKNCSFALTLFDDCEFRDCEWSRIGLQGSKTDFVRTFLNNPRDFVSAGFSGVKAGKENPKEHAAFQSYRLEQSKAQVARTLLHSHKEVGDDATYYQNAKLHDIQEMKSKIYRNAYRLRYREDWCDRGKGLLLIPHCIELGLLFGLGLTNAWGATLLRPVFGLVVIFVLFGFAYGYLGWLCADVQPWQKSFDITMIAGYTNQSEAGQNVALRVMQAVQLVLSIIMYTVFFSTAVSRNSRSRS